MKSPYCLAAGLVAACLALPASANYSQVITFGDSLSDNGNLLTIAGQPGFPYYNGRFSNGPVAVEVMAQQLGLGLTDFAVGGAQTGAGNLLGAPLYGTGVAGQIAQYGMLTGGSADASALYVVWAGPNDFFAGTNMANPSTAFTASTNLLNDVQALYGLGAREFFVPLMPNLGLTPMALEKDVAMPGFAALASGQSAIYNGLLSTGLANLSALPGIHIKTFDTFTFMGQTAANLASQGWDTTHRCFNAAVPSICADPAHYAFWDGVHPTAASHQMLGQAFAAAVPEPETYALMLAGLAVAVGLIRKRQGN